jgi:hypothetical protein
MRRVTRSTILLQATRKLVGRLICGETGKRRAERADERAAQAREVNIGTSATHYLFQSIELSLQAIPSFEQALKAALLLVRLATLLGEVEPGLGLTASARLSRSLRDPK